MPTAAHDFAPHTYLDIRVTGDRLEGRLSAHIVDLSYELSLPRPDSLLARPYAERHRAAIEDVLAARFHLLADGRQVSPRWKSFFIEPGRKLLSFEWEAALERPAATLVVTGPIFTYDRWHETHVMVHEGGSLRHQDLLDHGRKQTTYFTGSTWGRLRVVQRFALEGLRHVAIGPDHILFIVGLVLPGGTLLRLIKVVTAFTLAHSLTLALATLQILNPPARVIEPVIAASVVIIGIEALFASRREFDWRASIAFGFGLVHGFGFAGVLRELGLPQGALAWSLAAFNGGVELAQVGIVLAVAPALAALRSRRPETARRLVTWSAAAIILAGGWWLVERLR